MSCIPDSKAQDSGFHEQKFRRFQIPQAKVSRIPGSTSKIFPDSGFHKQKFPGLRIQRANVSRILDSTSKRLPDVGFYKQKIPGFRILQAKDSWTSDSTSKSFPDFGIRIPFHGAIGRRQVLERICQDNRILVRHLWNLKTLRRIRRHTTYFQMVEIFMSNIHVKDSCYVFHFAATAS